MLSHICWYLPTLVAVLTRNVRHLVHALQHNKPGHVAKQVPLDSRAEAAYYLVHPPYPRRDGS